MVHFQFLTTMLTLTVTTLMKSQRLNKETKQIEEEKTNDSHENAETDKEAEEELQPKH